MIRTLILGLILALAPMIARAQAPATASAAVPAQPAPLSMAQAQHALEVLKDDQKRAAFIATLEALARVQPAPGPAVAAAPGPTSAPPPSHAPPSPVAAAPPSPVAPAPGNPTAPSLAAGTAAAAAAQPTAAAPEAEKPLPLPLEPDSVGAQVLVGASDLLSRVSTEAIGTLRTVKSIPSLWDWAVVMVTNPLGRATLFETAWRLAVVLACALGLEWLAWRGLRRAFVALNAMSPVRDRPNDAQPEADAPRSVPCIGPGSDNETGPEEGPVRAEEGQTEPALCRGPSAWTLLRRLPLVLARLSLEALPIVVFAVVGHIVAGSGIGGNRLIRLVLLAAVDAYVLCRAVLIIARMILSPSLPRLRLVHLTNQGAAYAMRWLKRITVVSVFGYAAAEAGLLLGMTSAAHDALLKAVGLADHVFVGIIIFENRATIANWISGPVTASGTFAVFRRRTADIWHWIALFYLAALWLVWAIELRNGFSLLLRLFITTALVMGGTRLLLIVLLGTLDRTLRIGPEVSARYPGLEQRARLYHPLLRSALTALVFGMAFVVLLQFYGLDTLRSLTGTELGLRLLSALGTITVTLLVALLVWEGANAMMERHLARLTRQAQIARSARLRTLLPLLRTSLFIVILVVVVLTVLSEIGVNIAPLLAGAGIVGVAIGFGSQKLVQDLITGLFLLLENAMQVGDMVTVSGLSGTVEALSVRTIRLRAPDGSVHIIPFSAVTSVTNTNRGIGNAAVEVMVAYDEDTDRVGEVLKEIATEMRKQEPFKSAMLSDLQLWGVDKISPSSVTLIGQIVCTDSGRWPVQREFNRRVKRRF
jgi:small-conductance mechanosensitive channel